MLVLARKSGQSIRLGDGITVAVLSCGHGRVRIGVAAPRWLSVTRPDARRAAPPGTAVPRKG